uniref:Uncharacterized protein n=1 Tax=Marmota marmota marmota TaxID=9994 RepID=A0A8C5ZH09_MARMA
MNAAINTGHFLAGPKTEIQVPDSLWQLDTCEGRYYAIRGSSTKAQASVPLQPALLRQSKSPLLIIFQEISFALPLCMLILTPMVNHSAFYPVSIGSGRNVHFHFLPTLALGVNVSMYTFCFRVLTFAQ